MKNLKDIEASILSAIKKECDVAVIGMSGGADSTLVTILASKALGPERVHTLHMPANDYDRSYFNHRSWKVATLLGVHKKSLPMDELVQSFLKVINANRLTLGNTKSRLRMTMLYAYANELLESKSAKIRVLGTGNLSEDYIGYETKGGDSLADFFPIGELFKSEVYQFLDYYKAECLIEEEHIDRVPSAGLWENQTDEGELGFTYNEMEGAIRKFLNLELKQDVEDRVLNFVKKRHEMNKHKREPQKVLGLRKLIK